MGEFGQWWEISEVHMYHDKFLFGCHELLVSGQFREIELNHSIPCLIILAVVEDISFVALEFIFKVAL